VAESGAAYDAVLVIGNPSSDPGFESSTEWL